MAAMMDASKEMCEAIKAHPHGEIIHTFGNARCRTCHREWFLCVDFGQSPMSFNALWIWGESGLEDPAIRWHGSQRVA